MALEFMNHPVSFLNVFVKYDCISQKVWCTMRLHNECIALLEINI